jgi:N-acetylglucosaminyl-diphospho-decaprenol L-rhamnosyltransferase
MKISGIQENPELSLIYVNFRSARLLRRSIESLFERNILNKGVEIIVANNDASESWALRALQRTFSVRVVGIDKNIGFGDAANLAAQYARAPYLGFINPDTEIFSGNVADIPKIFRKHPDIGILGARLISDDGNPEPWSAGREVTLWQIIRNNVSTPAGKYIWESVRPRKAGFVSGAALFIRKELFDKLDGFDERFFLYFEDVDLCFRSRRSGYRVFSFPGIVFRHKGGKSHVSDHAKKRVFYESQERYFKKHRPAWEGKALSIIKRIFLP